MIGLYRPQGKGLYQDIARRVGHRHASLNRSRLRVRVRRFRSRWQPRSRRGQRPHRRHSTEHPRQRRLTRRRRCSFLNQGNAAFREVAGPMSATASHGRVSAAACAAGDFDRDGDVDLLMTTNNGPAVLFRNDQKSGNRQSQAATDRHHVEPRRDRRHRPRLPRWHVTVADGEERAELPLAVRTAGDVRRRKRDRVDRVVIAWPNGRTEEFKDVADQQRLRLRRGEGDLREHGR